MFKEILDRKFKKKTIIKKKHIFTDAMGSRPNLPDYFAFDKSYENILSIFYACTDEDPEKRPSAEKLVEILGLGTTTEESRKENAPDN